MGLAFKLTPEAVRVVVGVCVVHHAVRDRLRGNLRLSLEIFRSTRGG